MEPETKENLPLGENHSSNFIPKPIYKNKIFISFVIISFIVAFLVGGIILGNKKSTSTLTPTPSAQTPTQTASPSSTPAPTTTPTPEKTAQSFLEIPEYGVKFALTNDIKDAYYLPATADKGYVYLKVHSLDNEPQCAKDESSTAALSRAGKDDINEMSGMKYSDTFQGATIGNYFYYIDLAQYECAESVNGKAILVNVRKTFSEASKTITAL
ncbi:MAG: hypothetical protein UU45_C0022G0007 [Candidatus Levybacteria bacterium GW2011_GWA2_41_15]|nr:MAG: hypothetical protein UU45_C0022G0007 [Candidatus Levybacteria bacterium GW2011_GWA2_41_15]